MSLLIFVLLIVGLIYLRNLGSRIAKLEKRISDADNLQVSRSLAPEIKPKIKNEAKEVPIATAGVPETKEASGHPEFAEAIQENPNVLGKPESIANPFANQESFPSPTQAVQQGKGRETQNLEFKLGSRVLTAIGAVAFIFGVGFFLRYAFENDLISETMRVVLGVLAGIALLAAGEFFRKKYANYGQVLTGSGLGVLYLSIFAAYNFYQILLQSEAFLFMALVTAVGVWLSLRYDSMALAIFSQLGGLLTPLLLPSGENRPHALFLYLFILNLGVLAIVWKKSWRPLVFINFFGTILLYLTWFLNFYDDAQLAVALAYATLFFILFLGVSLVRHYAKGIIQDALDYLMLSLNTGFYFLICYAMIDGLHHEWMGTFTAILSLLYFILALLVSGEEAAALRLRQFYLAVAVIYLTLAIPIQLDKLWVTVGWGVESLALLMAGFASNSKRLRFFANALFMLVFFRLISMDIFIGPGEDAFLNDRVFSFVLSFVLFVSAIAIYNDKKSETDENLNKQEMVPAVSFLSICAYIIMVCLFTAEISDFYADYWMPVSWSVLGLLAGVISLKMKNFPLRLFAYGTFGVTFFRLLGYEGSVDIEKYQPIFNSRTFTFLSEVLSVGIFAFLLKKDESAGENEKSNMSVLMFLAINMLLLWLLTAELRDYFSQQFSRLAEHLKKSRLKSYDNMKRVAVSIGWTIYSIVLLGLGIIKKSTPVRQLAIVILGITILKVFLFDTADLSTFYKFVSFMALGIILLLAGFLYNRYKDRITEFIKA